MRVSTNTIFEAGIAAINRQQEALLKTQQQVASGRRILSPADDPVASARALQIEQAEASNTQYGVNRRAAVASLQLVEQALTQATGVLQNTRVRIVEAGNGAYGLNERQAIAADIRGLRAELLGIANATDGEGLFLFAGYQAGAKPFVEGVDGMQYLGDDGVRLAQVGASRHLAVSESGAQAFMRVREGNGSFVVTADATNSGTGIHDLGRVIDASQLTGDEYRIQFAEAGGEITYQVLNLTTGVSVLAAQPYVSGGAIEFDGMRVELRGAPADGDGFAVNPSRHQDVFATLDRLAALLEAAGDNPIGSTQLTNGLTEAIGNIDRGLDRFLVMRSDVGARLREVEVLQSAGEDIGLQYQQTLSNLRDVDYARAISDLSRQRIFLEAAQQSFITVSRLSLFEFL